MAVSVSDVVDSLFDDEFGLDNDYSDESNEECIYGYLGAAVWHWADARVDFPSEDEDSEVDVERSLLKGTFDDDDGLGPSNLTNDPDYLAASSLGREKDNDEHAGPLTLEQSSSNQYSKVTLARDDTVST